MSTLKMMALIKARGMRTAPLKRIAKRMSVTWFDPFDHAELCSMDITLTPRRLAECFYTKEIKRLTEGFKSVFSKELAGRTPITKTKIYPCP